MKEQRHRLISLLETAGPGLHARLTLREDAAEELMQELFIRLDGADGFAGSADPTAYAYRTAMDLAFDWRRRRRRQRDQDTLAADPPATDDPVLAPDPRRRASANSGCRRRLG